MSHRALEARTDAAVVVALEEGRERVGGGQQMVATHRREFVGVASIAAANEDAVVHDSVAIGIIIPLAAGKGACEDVSVDTHARHGRWRLHRR